MELLDDRSIEKDAGVDSSASRHDVQVRTILFILNAHLSNSVRFFGDWPTPSDESVDDDA